MLCILLQYPLGAQGYTSNPVSPAGASPAGDRFSPAGLAPGAGMQWGSMGFVACAARHHRADQG